MTIAAKIIEDSITDHGVRLTTLQLEYPRFIHAEFMTHRVFSRNASSSRAIPVVKMMEQVRTNPAMPIHWGKNQSGMQANEQLTGDELDLTKAAWRDAARSAATQAKVMMDLGAHKQVVNRILEPFQHIHVIVTATEFDNFFALRNHPDAQPEIRELAILMGGAMDVSPVLRSRTRFLADAWHLPYVTAEERVKYREKPRFLAQLSVARCARVSYLTHDGQAPSVEKDLALYDRLVGSVPLHASPTEHQAYPLPASDQWSKNFRGWRQFREQVEHDIQATPGIV